MFCPSCGSNEQMSQFCRACGTDLRSVRTSLERPDSITASAVTAREEIGRALPQIEKFLESPEEKRLRRMRAGVITAASGFGTFIVGLILASIIFGNVGQMLTIGGAGLGLLTFVVGLGLVLNGMRFTLPRKKLTGPSDADLQNQLDAGYALPQLRSSEESQSSLRTQTTSNLSGAAGSSVTEHTTKHLKTER